jgi:hypothetical protein
MGTFVGLCIAVRAIPDGAIVQYCDGALHPAVVCHELGIFNDCPSNIPGSFWYIHSARLTFNKTNHFTNISRSCSANPNDPLVVGLVLF